jgi:NAD(P)-dependent dehydrogenase (short-subunit alcohol dehydrogenase family)
MEAAAQSNTPGPAAGTLMAGKRGLIMGVANDRSIAWGIARAVAAQGAEVAFTYQGEALEKRVRPLAETLGSDIVLPCDVTDEASIDAVFETLLFFRECVPPGLGTDVGRRQPADADLSRRRTCHAALQRDGRSQSRA